MDFTGCADDDSIGPAVRGCRGDFDFTIKFEKIFFSLIPASIFIAVSLARVVYLAQKPTIVRGVFLRTVKLVSTGVFCALQLSLLVLSSTKSWRFGPYFISADALGLLAGLCLFVLSYLEHTRSPRPSVFLDAYLFITILLDICQTRTLWLASVNVDDIAFSRVFTCTVAFKALIIVLESQSKTKWIVRWDVKDHSPEETSGLYGLGAYLWLNQLLLRGYRKVLDISDLLPLDQSMVSEKLYANLSHRIDASQLKAKNHGLARAVVKALAVQFLLPVGPRIALGAFQFCQPFLIQTLLDYLQQPAEETSKNVGYGLIGATLLIYTGIATSYAFYWYFQERALYMARGLLASAIYRKTTELKASASDDSAALTLMSSDIDRTIQGCMNMHEFWANTIEVGLACWLLSRQIGPAFVAPLAVVAVCFVCVSMLAKLAGPRQKVWMEKIQKRVGLTSTTIAQMKSLKISGLAEVVQNSIQSLRVDDLKAGSSFRTVLCFSAGVGYTPLFLSPVIAFAFASRTLDVTTIFTSISYMNLLATPLSLLFQMVPSLLAALTCLNRIQAFLEQEPRFDFRESPVPGRSKVESEGEKPSGGALDGSTSSPSSSDPPKIRICGGSFGWEIGKMSLRDINLDIPASQLTMVIGPVASGKSTLCKALLGEVPVSQGQVLMIAATSRNIGYCDQNPYLANKTARENIVGFAPFHQGRYDEVIEATMLRPDLALFPEGDATKVGSNGITLSGGQKQRLSMARALYLDTDFYLFDDILSGLDADTEEQVFLRVFSAEGLLRKRNATAVLCTHSVRHLPAADRIVALGSGGDIVEQGTFQELVANEKYVARLGVEETSGGSRASGSSTPVEDKPAMPQVPKPATKQPLGLTAKEAHARMTGDWTVYRHYFARMGAIHKIGFIVFGACWGGLLNAGTIWLKFWSEDVTSPNPAHSNSWYNGVYAVFQIGSLVSLVAVALACYQSMVKTTGSRMHLETLRTVINAPLRFFTTTDTGVVVNLFSQDMTLLDNQLPQGMLNMVLGSFEGIGMAAVIATSSPYVAITYPFLVAILYVLQKFYLYTSRQMRLLDLEAKSPLYSHFIDTIKGIATFRAFGWVPEGLEQNYRLLDTSQRPAYLLAMIQRWLTTTLQLLVTVLAVIIVTLATQLRTSTAFTGAGLVALMSFGDTLSQIVRWYTLLETSIGAVARLKAFSENVKPENKEGEDVVPPVEWPLQGGIEINGVSASYDEGDGKTASPEHLVLNDLQLSIAPGEKVAICGRSGSGKSSLLLLLLHLLDPLPPSPSPSTTQHQHHPHDDEKEKDSAAHNTGTSKGTITIDALPLSTLSRPALRDRLVALPQDPVFLPAGTTIRANLDPHGAASPADCRAALEAVSLWEGLVLNAQGGGSGSSSGRGSSGGSGSEEERDAAGGGVVVGDEGLDAPLRADTLSQGQKQLFSLARAIVRRRVRMRTRMQMQSGQGVGQAAASHGGGEPGVEGGDRDGGILLLDEVSSSVDKETDEQMQRVIMREFAGYTIVMVSHRLGMVAGFDRVVVMDAGRIVETGRPTELVTTEGSRFRELWMVGNKGKN